MLEDFIESNGLEAKVLPYAAKGSLIKCSLFKADSLDILVVFFAKDRLSEEKVKKALACNSLRRIEGSLAEEITGYEAKFLPPISVYGVKVLLDSKVANAPKAKCIIADEKTLDISPKEILEANEESEEADLTL